MAIGKNFMIGTAAIAAVSFSSCLKEKECPPDIDNGLYVVVGEKNYENVDEIAQAVPIDESLPFNNYVGLLDVRYLPLTGAPVRQAFVPAAGESVVSLPLEMLPAGGYEIIIAGNASPENFVDGTDYLLELHPDGVESGDHYLVDATAELPLSAARTLSLVRTKGQLLLSYQSLPAEITGVSLQVSGLSKNVDQTFAYSGVTSVSKDYLLLGAPGSGVLTLLLAPTVAAASPNLMIILRDENGSPVRSFSDIPLTIDRNRITAMELRYDPAEDTWELWISIEGEWVQFHELDIQ